MAYINNRNCTKKSTELTVSNIKKIEIIAGFNYLIDTYDERSVKNS